MESFVIILICSCLIIIFWRSGSANYAIGTSPVLVPPFFQFIGYPVWKILETAAIVLPNYVVYAGLNLFGLAMASFMIAIFATKFKQKKNRNLYIASLGLYCFILTGIFINYHIQKYLIF